MTLLCEFFAAGKPEPAGSKKGFPIRRKNGAMGVAITDANPKAKQWQAVVSCSAQGAMAGQPLAQGPLELHVTFTLQRPSSHFGTGKNANTVKASAPEFPTSKPDVLKLTRAVEDALTDVVWRDDAQVVTERIEKRYGETPGCRVRVFECVTPV